MSRLTSPGPCRCGHPLCEELETETSHLRDLLRRARHCIVPGVREKLKEALSSLNDLRWLSRQNHESESDDETSDEGSADDSSNEAPVIRRINGTRDVLRTTPGVQENEGGDAEPDQEDEESSYGNGKFMVCDHCRAHALPCDEAPICHQCQMSKTPCVHRICRVSPDLITDCPNPKCRYAHLDYLPTFENFTEDDYIILPGTLKGYLEAGRIPWMTWERVATSNIPAFNEEVKEIQKYARQLFQDAVAEGIGPLDKLRHGCGPLCNKTLGVTFEPDSSSDSGSEH